MIGLNAPLKVVEGVDPCPLCEARAATLQLEIPYARIWHALEDVWSARISDETMARHQRTSDAVLYRCVACELEYFSPMIPGDWDFYRQLMTSMPYHERRWEFQIVARLIPAGASVIDLGAGSGAFLRSIRHHVGRVVGVDHNPEALRELSLAGIETTDGNFDSLASREANSFDVACSFHTLEHLPRVTTLMQAAVACTRAGGSIFVSVPNRDRAGREELEPLDCPPHHISRWSQGQLQILSKRFGLELVQIRFEEPGFRVARLAYPPSSRERSDSGNDRDPPFGRWIRRAVDPLVYLWRTRTHAYTRRGIYGHTMLAEFRRR